MEAPAIPVINNQAHESSINSLDVVGGDTSDGALEIVTCSEDGSLKIWDPRQSDVPVMRLCPEDSSPTRNCWSVAFGGSSGDFGRSVAAGFDNGDLKIFDLRAQKVHFEDNLEQGICSIQFDRKIGDMNRLVASTVDDGMCIYDLTSASPKVLFKNKHRSSSTNWSVQHLPQNPQTFAMTRGDGSLQIWNHQTFTCSNEIQLSSKSLIKFDWNSGFKGLGAIGSLDNVLRIVLVNKL